MKKRIGLIFLSIVLLVSMMGGSSLANLQIQVKKVNINEVYFVEGEDIVTGDSIIRPTMTVGWENPAQWGSAQLPADVHDPDYYEVIVTNITRGGSNTIRIDEGSPEFTNKMVELHEKIKLDTGSLYNVEVKPYHYHTLPGGGTELAVNSGLPENAYAITDINVKFETTESSINITWDDLGSADFTYRIVYALGDYSTQTKQTLINNKEGEISVLTSNSVGVSKFYDPVEKRNKLSYKIEGNIYPGQIYSVLVEPTVEYFNSESIMRNRNYPLIRTCSTNVNLDIYEEGDYLRLEWQVPGSFKVGQSQESYALVEATLLQYQNGQSSNVVIFDGDAAVIGYYKVPKPILETEYEIHFVYKAVADQSKPAIKPISNRASFVPSDLLITPTRPIIPKLFSQSILEDLQANYTTDQVRQRLAEDYFVKGYTFTGNLNGLMDMNNTFRIMSNNTGINLIWGAFQRIDVDETSPTYNQYIFDSNIYYDIWVTDSLESMAYSLKAVDNVRYGSANSPNNITDGQKIYGYSQELVFYYNDETGELEPIIPDKQYYIKIVAKKKTASGDLISEPTITSVYYTYGGDSYEPPIITKPPMEVKDSETTSTGVSVTWKETWWEVISMDAIATDALFSWRHQLWVGADGTIYGEKTAGTTYFPIYLGEAEVTKLKNYLVSVNNNISIQSRKVDLGQDAYGVSDVKYKFLKIPYEFVQQTIKEQQEIDPTYDFDDYYLNLIKEDKEGTGALNWVSITPTRDFQDSSKILYREEGLLPNTSYLFMIYPYRQVFSGEILYAHYPTPIVVSTEPEEVVVQPDPTVPNLYISNTTDMSITVSWKYNLDFQYELVYSIFEDRTKAEPVNFSIGTTPLDPLYPINGKYYEVTIDQLFPNTEYYFWIRAKNPITSKISGWSNAVLGRTRDVDKPYPPRGFGIASLESMMLHGFNASVTDDYIAVEWVLDANDIEADSSSDLEVTKNYSYIVEVADNREFIDLTIIESTGGEDDKAPENVQILEKNLVLIQDLQANRPYYLRVKTKITVTGKKDGQLIIKESEAYSPIIRVITIAIDDEYDGIVDPDTGVLPSSDYEIKYDPALDTLDFRFRDDSIGADGLPDNNVDQRLINNLISQNIYIYDIDVSAYQNQPIKKRTISIPYSIVEAFTTYKVNILVNAGDIQIELPYGAFKSAVDQQVKQYGVAPSVNILIETLPSDTLKNNVNKPNLRTVSEIQNMVFTVSSNKLTTKLNYTDKEMNIQLKVNNKYEAFRVERIGAVKDYKNNWTDVPSTFNNDTGTMSYKTSKLGTYGGYVLDSLNTGITSDKGHWSESMRKAVTTEYNFTGLTPYNPGAKVTETELINIVYGLLLDRKNINLDDYITNNVSSALLYSGITKTESVNRKQLTREEALSILTRTYEIVNDEIIIPSSTLSAAVNKNTSIGGTYKVALAKAAQAGLIGNVEKVRPKDAITYGELFAVLSKIIN